MEKHNVVNKAVSRINKAFMNKQEGFEYPKNFNMTSYEAIMASRFDEYRMSSRFEILTVIFLLRHLFEIVLFIREQNTIQPVWNVKFCDKKFIINKLRIYNLGICALFACWSIWLAMYDSRFKCNLFLQLNIFVDTLVSIVSVIIDYLETFQK